jgi:peroxiredoxin
MSAQKKQSGIRVAVLVCAIILVVVVIWSVVKQRPAEQASTEHHHEHTPLELSGEGTGDANLPDISIKEIIAAARSWQPAYEPWFGKTAPDFTLTDINGKEHKLSDYHGKDVMIAFWTTWCGPCLIEIPNLIALRKIVSEDKLAILAISNEDPALLKKFAAERKINYTILSDPGTMPLPFNLTNAIPCSFFIDTDGKIKLATIGLVSLGEIKAILRAK